MNKQEIRVWDKKRQVMAQPDIIDFYHKIVLCNTVVKGYFTATSSAFDDVVFMQSIGIKDDDGREIYEGDVVVCGSEGCYLKGYIELIDGQFVLTKSEGKYISYNFTWQNAENIKIVGNVYEQEREDDLK